MAAIVSPLDGRALLTATPAAGWTVRDQLSHLAGFDDAAITALREPEGFRADLARRLAEGDDPVAEYTAHGRAMDPSEVVSWWAGSRAELLALAADRDPTVRIPWYGPSMSAMSFFTARLMETWAHGQDVRDALGLRPEVSDRLRHVAHIGVGARSFSYAIHEPRGAGDAGRRGVGRAVGRDLATGALATRPTGSRATRSTSACSSRNAGTATTWI